MLNAMEQLRETLAAVAANERGGDGVVCVSCLNGVHEQCHGERCLCACSGVWKPGEVPTTGMPEARTCQQDKQGRRGGL
jgi:hypothetical protein